MTKPTTQQLARELADSLKIQDQIKALRSQQLPRTQEWPVSIGYGRDSVTVPYSALESIQEALGKESISIKKQLQEALASE
jgi:hypothetical protein